MFTSISATEVLIDKIVEIPGTYPRFEVDQGRIELFYEHMQCGQEFPPINIVKDESNKGYYVLLGGKHRLEACRRLGKRKIKAFRMAVERQHWRLVAASLNAMSSKPLKGEELRKVIQDAYKIDGIRDAEEIAHKLNCTVQYVRKILKPVRDVTKEKLKEQVVQLRKEGLSEREIAAKVDKPQPTVHRIITGVIQNENCFEMNHLETRRSLGNSDLEASQNKTVSFWDTTKSEKISSNFEKKPTNSVIIPAEFGKSDENIFSDETAYNNCSPQEPRSVIPDLEKYVDSWTPTDKQALRAIELAGAGWNVEQIAKRLDQTELFVRNVAAAVITFFQNQSPKHPLANRSHQEIAEALSMEPAVAKFMGDIVICSPGIITERKNIWWWLRENFPKYRSGAVERGSLIDIIRHETVYWKAVADNVLPPWEQEEEKMEPLEKFPKDMEKRFLDYMNLIDELIDMSNKGALKKIAQTVLQRCNMVVTEQNKLRRKLGQWNVPSEDNNNYESVG